MNELTPVYLIAATILAYLAFHVLTRRFDPFAPVWLFLVGYVQVYIIQALSYHDWAVISRGVELTAAANMRALWALVWFLAVYHLGGGRLVASVLREPPRAWSTGAVNVLAPPMAIWGLFCAGVLSRGGQPSPEELSPEELILRSFGFLLMVAAIMLVVTGRAGEKRRTGYLAAGLFTSALFTAVWMFNGKRSPGIVGVLSTVCAFYVGKGKRPSWPVLFGTGLSAVLVVTLALGWRNNARKYESSFGGFLQFATELDTASMLENLNIGDGDDPLEYVTQESTEYGGFILMMSTVPEKSDYDYGANYLRVFSTFIPRIIWADKPLFGRDAWRAAWVHGSEIVREEDFTSPAIGILGATQLNGGAIGTLAVLAALAMLQRTAYEYFRRHADVPWVQFWWSMTYYVAWFMVVNDDPMVWFYYSWGFTTLPVVVLVWLVNRFAGSTARASAPAPAPAAAAVTAAGMRLGLGGAAR
ncbi:hypothetical protein OJF2_01680 [Aquisphaera giovannonii]|uniref:Oligosaccharide repeat unit polymerase n=1 Tax=Aquisphaera giovannonii TaxID=406548 RepID=A0A5B9VTM4_9BACT|nr:hypothetical protein [Aquisphaera giovannonii]QEH31703.1 hypothetical protein OJF2_01680 [Aquisphaera giovannonii]